MGPHGLAALNKPLLAALADGRKVEVAVLRHPGYRHLRLSVRPDGRVQLTAPARTRTGTLTRFLNQQLHWLQQHLKPRVDPALPSTLELRAARETWQVEYGAPVTRVSAATSSKTLRLPAAGPDGAALQLIGWLKRRARQELGSQLGEISLSTGLGYRKLSIRGQRSRWGSYSARGDVSLNWKLLFLPPELARYVLLHELCHSVHLDHSKEYWATVRRFEPDLDRLRLAMRDASSHLPDWLALLPASKG